MRINALDTNVLDPGYFDTFLLTFVYFLELSQRFLQGNSGNIIDSLISTNHLIRTILKPT